MHKSRLPKLLTAVGAVLAAVPAVAQAQLRDVVSKEVSVGRSEAALHLELSGGEALDVALHDGSVSIDGDEVGTYQPGDGLDSAWRALLGQAVALDDGALSKALADWTPPEDLSGSLADVAGTIDTALERALADQAAQDAPSVSVSVGSNDEATVLRSLLGSTRRLGLLQEALSGVGADFSVHVDEDVDVARGEVVKGTLLVIQGDARIEGEVDGDVVVVGGSVQILDGGHVTGELRLADARVVRNLGTVDGGVVDVLSDDHARENEVRDSLREEIRKEIRSEVLRNVTRGDRDYGGFSLMAPFRPLIRGVGGLIEELITVLVLGLLGAAAISFAGNNVDVIAETARRAPGRSAVVGLAGSFLLVPVWILGAVALVVSIIGIPVAVAWLPLFPLAACVAALIGYLAVARNAGEWLADSHYPWTGWIRRSNPLFTTVGGLLGLMIAFMAANVVSIAPFLGFVSGLLVFLGTVLTIVAVLVGFGAVLLSRGGRRREYWKYDSDAAWEAAMSVEVEPEVEGAGEDATPGGGRTNA